MNVTCPNCGMRLKAKDEHAGKTARCPKCSADVQVPGETQTTAQIRIPPATDRQKEFATSLGIDFPSDINRRDISELIDAAVQRRDDERMHKLDELNDRESQASQSLREELLAEIDEEDCRLSKAEPSQMVGELEKRNRGAILIHFDFDDIGDFSYLNNVEFQIAFSENMDSNQMRSLLGCVVVGLSRQSNS